MVGIWTVVGTFLLASLLAWVIARALAAKEIAKIRIELQSALQEKTQFQERAAQVPILTAKLADAEVAATQITCSVTELRDSVSRLSADLKNLQETRTILADDLTAVTASRDSLQAELSRSAVEVAELKTLLASERRQFDEKKAMLDGARDEAKEILGSHFKSLANEILETKSTRFAEHNRAQVEQILQPLKVQLKDFREKAEAMQLSDAQQQAALKVELTQLKDLNRQMSEEAHGLATALRGQAKMRGNWGELVLENVLERSGLRRDQDYKREVNFTTDTGRRRPDVIVYLPQGKHIVIDAKVSLNAYTRYVNSDAGDLERAQALREHVAAVSSRIKELADKSYFELPGLNSPEVVFMFIPIESAFVEALRADETLFQTAIERNVLVATPTTLLTSLNIVRQLWRFEQQNEHAAALAERAGKVYKKLNTFLRSMEGVGAALNSAKATYSVALGQLYSGKDNLIKQVNDFKQLGVSVQSDLPEQFVSKAELELEYFPEADGQLTPVGEEQPEQR